MLIDLQGQGGSDDDSVMYCDRNNGTGVPPTNHEESEYELDFETKAKWPRKRRCRKHFKEYARYICKDHKEILCPKCLVMHKLCDFQAQGAELTHQAKTKFRHLLTKINMRYNTTQATLRKVKQVVDALDLYRDKQLDDINYSFDEVIKTLNARRTFLSNQVSDLVNKLKSELRVDEEFATRKRDAEGAVLTKIRNIQDFVFAVEEKVHKRVLVTWNQLGEQEKEFDLVDGAW